MILNWRVPANHQYDNLRYYFSALSPSLYVAIIYVWNNSSSATYVKQKKKYGDSLGCVVKVFGQEDYPLYDCDTIIQTIDDCNDDQHCLWILVQFPLPDYLQKDMSKILQAVVWYKDIDALGGLVQAKLAQRNDTFLPATAKAVCDLLVWYNNMPVPGDTITILGQSQLVWYPLANEFIRLWITVISINKFTPIDTTIESCLSSSHIISCTWDLLFFDDKFVRTDQTQTVIDVWRWKYQWKPVGDVQIDTIKDKVAHYSPVPWGVWPMTISSLFANIKQLYNYALKLA